MYRIEQLLKVIEMGVQSCIPFVDLFQYIPKGEDMVNVTSCQARGSILLRALGVHIRFRNSRIW